MVEQAIVRDRASGRRDKPHDDGESIKHKANALKAGLLLSLILLIVAAGACYAGVLLLKSHMYHYLGPAAFIAASFFLVAAGTVPIVMFREGCIEEDQDQKCKTDCDDLVKALNEIPNATLSGLAKANFRQMRMFTVIALRQARMSYYASLVAASVALLVLTAGGAVTVGLVSTSAKITAGSVTAVGVAMSGFLSATFLKTYEMAARQMSYYYGQPLVHCYLLHSEWLTLMLTKHPEWKADISLWQKVVDATIQASKNAQNHLLSMQVLSTPQANRKGKKGGSNRAAETDPATILPTSSV
jgi:TRADD-N domain-containing protein